MQSRALLLLAGRMHEETRGCAQTRVLRGAGPCPATYPRSHVPCSTSLHTHSCTHSSHGQPACTCSGVLCHAQPKKVLSPVLGVWHHPERWLLCCSGVPGVLLPTECLRGAWSITWPCHSVVGEAVHRLHGAARALQQLDIKERCNPALMETATAASTTRACAHWGEV